ELRRRERSDAEVEIHLPSRDEEVLHLRDVAAHPDSGDHRAEEVEADNAAVDPRVEMGHGGKAIGKGRRRASANLLFLLPTPTPTHPHTSYSSAKNRGRPELSRRYEDE